MTATIIPFPTPPPEPAPEPAAVAPGPPAPRPPDRLSRALAELHAALLAQQQAIAAWRRSIEDLRAASLSLQTRLAGRTLP